MMKIKAKRTLCIAVLLALVVCATMAFASCKADKVDTNAEYTITFETEGGSVIDPITVKGGEKAEKPENPSKAGHVFKGWYTDLSNTEGGSFIFDETAITADVTLYALWQIRQYTISYQDDAGNAIAGLNEQVVDWGSLLQKPDESSLQREGYLIKWYTRTGDIWDFETDKVVSNTTLVCRYVTTKDSYNAADIAANFYPTYDKTNVGPEFGNVHYTEGSESVIYTYDYSQKNKKGGLQQIVLNVELATIDYSTVTICFRPTAFSVDEESGEYTFDPAGGGTFSQYRAYILTDVGGDVSYNDEPSSGYNPVNYYIQSTGANKDLFTIETVDGWSYVTFDLAALKFWYEGEKLYSFAFGYVCNSYAVEFKSVVFNKVDKTQKFNVQFEDRLGNELVETQSILWNEQATKPATLENANGRIYTGEWLDASGEVFDFTSRIRNNVTLTPQYVIEDTYSWTGEDVAKDFFAVYNANPANPANEYINDGNAVYIYNNANGGNSLKQVVADNLNLEKGNVKYLTFTWRVINDKTYEYNPTGVFALIRIYIVTDAGGDVYNKDTDDASKYYVHFAGMKADEVTTPVDMSAKYEDGWYTVTVDLTSFEYFNNGTVIKGLAIGTTTGANNGIEVKEISFRESADNLTATNTVSFVDDEGNAITGIDSQTVPYGKAVAMPDSSLVPLEQGESFAYWADANGNEYNFNMAVTEDVTLKAVLTNVWTGAEYTFKGQDIASNFTACSERYGNTATNQRAITLDANGDATFDYSVFGKANMGITILNAGIRVHEGSKLVVTYKSSTYPTYTVNRINLCIAFRGHDPATQIKNTNTSTYYQYKDIAYGTTSGSSDAACVSFTVAEDGTVTATFDLYAMQQAYKSKGIEETDVDVNYIDAFTFMIVETNSGTGAKTSNATLTYKSLTFKDVQLDVKPVYNLSGQSIVEGFTASYERYGNTVDKQNALTLDENGDATYDFSGFNKANMTLTMLNAGIKVQENSKLVVTYKSSTYPTYTVNRINLCIAFRGHDPATQINNANTSTYYQYKDIAYGTTSGSSDAACVSFTVAEDGTVTATFDLYAMQQAYIAKGIEETGVDYNYIDAFTFMIVETNSGTSAKTSNATLTYLGFEFQNVVIGGATSDDDATTEDNTTTE